MASKNPYIPDPKLDLVLERVVDISPSQLWAAWTQPQHIVHWFTPAPWTTVDCKIDLRPGGLFYTLMRSPEGEEFPNHGSFLEVVENERLVWTDALQAGFRPAPSPKFGPPEKGFFTALLTFEPEGAGTRYRAVGMHADEAARKWHEEMGFHDGWGKALDQLVAHMKKA